jgi:hypothetical protein
MAVHASEPGVARRSLRILASSGVAAVSSTSAGPSDVVSYS